MNGKIVGSFVVIVSLAFGAFVYWSQEYRYYAQVSAEDAQLTMVNIATGQPEPVLIDGFEGIDGSSSPIRFRACFTLPLRTATLTETYQPYATPTPLIAPSWFDCFDAVEIGTALERGEALAFLSQREIHDGVDRVIAVFPDGRAFAWNQLNEKYQD
jgi:Family of unknown function (DUF6446)